ncbi:MULTISPECIES: MobH family relaxase [Enterobacteriaceae]|uniref:MobH family relaxase n=1 Tax=Enterobacteriaceae TaxID=543 RepID=UPI0006689587|nr:MULTISPECIES: MobH family relaxase [Enterobacteriaceae]MCZ9381385.1 TraI domain-containing protein [Klebsiella pneumoniae]OVH09331.1 relaxase [Klebsiella pneumoniae]OVH13154.1 relaxase [Klebsiella pneumoniae]HBY1214575.1 relaxase [Klebsiella pneumoniae]HBY1270431.1 relaxase [Klebsiella pneumoniae]
MFALFQRKRPVQAATTAPATATKAKGLMRPEPAASLLATARRQKLLEHIWQRTSLSRQQFAVLYLGPLERYAELVQQFPASESHHHAYPGGLLDHGLEIVAYALKLRQSHLLPAGATPEDQAAQAEAWTAATAYAALLHDIGKIAVDLHVEMNDGSLWHPWHGPLQHPYRFRYRKDREYRLHNAASGLLYNRVLDREILDWLSSYPELWAALLYVLADQHEHAGVLGELVTQADRASVAQELGGDPAKAMAAPKHALQRKLLEGLRYLLKEELKLNQPQASDGWLTQDALWLVSKTVSDKLRAHLLSQGIEGIPANNTAVFNILQDHGMLQATPDDKAIWKAVVTSDTGWTHTFTLLRLAPALIWEGSERPPAFQGTVEVVQDDTATADASPASPNVAEQPLPSTGSAAAPALSAPGPGTQAASVDGVDALLDLLGTPDVTLPSTTASPNEPTETGTTHDQEPELLPAAPSAAAVKNETQVHPSGEHFIAWLRQHISTRKLIINDAKALVHTVSDTVYLVSPGLFQRYAQEHPKTAFLAKQENVADWQWIQKAFEKLQLHRKQDNGLNIWTCEVTGPRKSRRLHGYLLADPTRLFDGVPPNNPYLILVMTR